ncbi:retrovirus-related pol polyprotein from transposon TNT 1-94, partial [Tanacetum coccineum]
MRTASAAAKPSQEYSSKFYLITGSIYTDQLGTLVIATVFDEISFKPLGFEEGTDNNLCLLKKSLYGHKQSPRQWYKQFDVYMISNGFSRSSYDSCVYFKEFAP